MDEEDQLDSCLLFGSVNENRGENIECTSQKEGKEILHFAWSFIIIVVDPKRSKNYSIYRDVNFFKK